MIKYIIDYHLKIKFLVVGIIAIDSKNMSKSNFFFLSAMKEARNIMAHEILLMYAKMEVSHFSGVIPNP